MAEIYKLTSVKMIYGQVRVEETFIEINRDRYRIIATNPKVLPDVTRQTLERMTREEAKTLLDNLNRRDNSVNP